jgi:predicted dehydrogenase
MHFSQAKRVIDRGTPCLLEKPAAMSADECNELSHIAAERAVVVHVAHHLRHQDTYARMQEILNNGELGDIVTASAEWSFKMNRAAPSASWKLDPLKNGLSAMNDAGIHIVDVMIGLLGPGSLRGAASAVGLKTRHMRRLTSCVSSMNVSRISGLHVSMDHQPMICA